MTDSMAGHFLSRGDDRGRRRRRRPHRRQRRHREQDRHLFASPCSPRRTASPSTSRRRRRRSTSTARTERQIPIEERASAEVLSIAGHAIAPDGCHGARHVAFDVTPARYVTAIVTDEGICRPPYDREPRGAAGAPGNGHQRPRGSQPARRDRPRHRDLLRRDVGRRPATATDAILSNVIASQVAGARALRRRRPGGRGAGAPREPAGRSSRRRCRRAGVALEDVGLVAATAGPGLIGALLVGLSAAKALAFARGTSPRGR